MVLREWSKEWLNEFYGDDLRLNELITGLCNCTYEQARVILELERLYRMGNHEEY